MRSPRFRGRQVLLLVIALTSIVVWLSRFHREPTFEGRTANEWVQQLVRHQTAARRALLALGPDAAPALARAVEQKHHRSSSLLSSLRPKLPALIRRFIPSSAETIIRGDRAVEVLFDLGTNAATAAPALIREELRHEVWDLNVAHATLVRIGAAGAPQFTRVLQNSDSRERVAAARYLGLCGPSASTAAPALAKVIGDADPLARAEAISALVKMGPAAQSALPALKRSLNHGDPDSRIRIMEALWRIGGDSKSTAPLLSSMLADRTNPHRAKAAELLGQMGSAAASAMPVLSNVLQEEFSYTRVKAEEAVAQIERSLSTESPPTR